MISPEAEVVASEQEAVQCKSKSKKEIPQYAKDLIGKVVKFDFELEKNDSLRGTITELKYPASIGKKNRLSFGSGFAPEIGSRFDVLVKDYDTAQDLFVLGAPINVGPIRTQFDKNGKA